MLFDQYRLNNIKTIFIFRYPSLEVEFDLSPEEKRCVQRTLPIVQRAAATLGPSSIFKMFETYPLSMVYFSDFRYPEVYFKNVNNADLIN